MVRLVFGSPLASDSAAESVESLLVAESARAAPAVERTPARSVEPESGESRVERESVERTPDTSVLSVARAPNRSAERVAPMSSGTSVATPERSVETKPAKSSGEPKSVERASECSVERESVERSPDRSVERESVE